MGMLSDLPSDIYNNSIFTQQTIIQSYTTKEHKCLSNALYFEARGESKDGIIAVGNVIINRVNSSKFPNTICDVINQKGQFSYKWDGKSDIPKNKKKYQEIQIIALDIINNKKVLPNTALFYHNNKVKPYWSNKYICIKKIGNHIFYKI
jgi:spore germination cell wall hydrolase CwlJ-like protein